MCGAGRRRHAGADGSGPRRRRDRLLIHRAVLGAGERIFLAPLTIEPMSTTVFSGGAVAHVFAAHP
jgi:hypothetical protein